MKGFSRQDFGSHFTWGCATAAYQIEGSPEADGKGPSIWDTFVHKRNLMGRSPIKDRTTADLATDSYRRYPEDVALIKSLGFDAYRFSVSWPRIFPRGSGPLNQAGIDHYDKVVDTCLEAGIEPWVTLYHWDLPQALEDRGGWTNRDIVNWFADYIAAVTSALSDRVTNWMVFNETLSFTLLGYLLGVHAPGRRGLGSFLAAVHHVNLATARGARALRAHASQTPNVGTTCYLSPVLASGPGRLANQAERSADALFNRTFIEPNLGLGYPVTDAPILKGIRKFIRDGDLQDCAVDLDFLGVQYYTRLKAPWLPIPRLWTLPHFGHDRSVGLTSLGWEIRPEGLGMVLDKVWAYGRFPKLIVTEGGASFPDELNSGRVRDPARISYYKAHLAQVLAAQRRGVAVDGYFCWSALDNFEWTEGLRPRFGLTYVDYATQERHIKDSGYWFSRLLGGKATRG
ncbi:MAG: GH1 family beta-glucosidase [Candidatus Nanopelagicales bacterium]|nr:GH1 family beta-glucosidase [Candidatus Nanopelagicales bacterium]MDZ4248632.1 GH1 family beta-glucosidase [Candidatus Nanopelagicales bacterium]